MKGTTEEKQEYFYSNMSQRAAELLKDDVENMGPVRLKDVDEAQSNLINKAKDLAAKGDIVITKGGTDDEFI